MLLSYCQDVTYAGHINANNGEARTGEPLPPLSPGGPGSPTAP